MTVVQAIMATARTLLGVAVLCGALGLIAFGPRGKADLAPGRVVVTYWEKWTDFEGDAMRRLCGVFNRTAGAAQGVYVDYVVTTQIDLKTLVATSGGDPPDLAGLWPHNISSFAAKGALQPLDDWAAAAGIGGETLIPIYYEMCRYHGKLYGLPSTPWSLALYYNKGLFREFAAELRAGGHDPERPPRTLDELAAYGRIIQRRNARGDLDLMGFLPAAPETIGWYWHFWGVWSGGTLFDPAVGRMRVDTDAFIHGYEWVRDYAGQFGVRDVLRFESSLANFNSPDNPFMSGRLAMMQQGPWFANMIRQYAPDIEFGVAPFPTIDGRETSYCSGDVLCIPTGARHPREAWQFIAWLYNGDPIVVPSGEPEPQPGYEFYYADGPAGRERRPMPPLRPIEWLCWNHYKNGPLLEPSEAFLATHPNPGVEIHERLARSELAMSDPPLPNWIELRDEFGAAYRAIWGGGADPAQRLRACQTRLDALTEIARRELARYGEPYP